MSSLKRKSESFQSLEVDFPRGPQPLTTVIAPRSTAALISAHSGTKKQDDLFRVKDTVDQGWIGKPKPSKKEKKEKKVEKPESTTPTYAEGLTLKKMTVGSMVLGVVKQVNDLDAVISLPNGLTGFVTLPEISDVMADIVAKSLVEDTDDSAIPDMDDLLSVGMVVKCVVTSISSAGTSKTRLELSLRPSLYTVVAPGFVLTGAISSYEDRGYLVSFGKTKGFLKYSSEERIKIGSLIEVVISKLGNIPTLKLPSDLSEDIELDMDHVVPGTKISGKISSIHESGLVISTDIFTGTVDLTHLNKPAFGEWKEEFSKGEMLECNVIYVSSNKRQVHLSLRKDLSEPMPVHSIGEITSMEVLRIDPNHGVLGRLPEGAYCYCHVSNLSDTRSVEYPTIGKMIDCRVLGINHFDHLVNVSCKSSYLSEKIATYSDLHPGDLVSGEIATIKENGLVLTLAPRVSGFVPDVHCTDAKLGKKTLAKYKVGGKVTGRVLSVDPERNHVAITLKPTLVSSEYPVVTSFVSKGVTHGFITSIKPEAVYISFYNNVYGKCRAEHCAPGTSVVDYYVGQVIKTRIISGGLEGKIECSMWINDTTNDQVSVGKGELGGVFKGLVTGYVEKSLNIQLSDGRLALLPIIHLSDHSHYEALFNHYTKKVEAGEKITLEVMIINLKPLTVTAKPCLIAAHRLKLIPNVLIPVSQAYGFVRKVSSAGAMIQFLGCSSLCMKSCISTSFVNNCEDVIKEGATVVCTVVSSSEGFNCSIKDAKEHPDISSMYSVSYFNEKSFLDGSSNYKMGQLIDCVVSDVKTYGLLLSVADWKVVIPSSHIPSEKKFNKGEKVSCVVLDVHSDKKILDCSVLPRLLNLEKRGHSKAGETKTSKMENVVVTVELTLPDYYVISCLGSSGLSKIGKCLSRSMQFASQLSLNKVGVKIKGQLISGDIYLLDFSNPKTTNSFYDDSVSNAKDILVGHTYNVKIQSADTTGVIVSFGTKCSHIIARVKPSNLDADLSLLAVNKIVPCTVLSINVQGHAYHVNLSLSYEEAIDPKTIDISGLSLTDVDESKFSVGDIVAGKLVSENVFALGKNLFARIHPADFVNTPLRKSAKAVIRTLDPLYVSLKHVGNVEKQASKSKSKKLVSSSSVFDLEVGQISTALVLSVDFPWLIVSLGPRIRGRVHITSICDGPNLNPLSIHQAGDLVPCRIIGTENTIEVSLKPSLVASFDDIKISNQQLIVGYIQRFVKGKGCFVFVTSKITAHVKFSDLSDEFIPENEISERFPSGKVVIGRILDCSNDKATLSLKRSVVVARPLRTINDFKVGMIVSGTIRKVVEFGVFIKVDNSNLSGLSHRSEISVDPLFKPDSYYSVGDAVRAKILILDSTNQKVTFGLKAEYLENDDPMEDELVDDLAGDQQAIQWLKEIDEKTEDCQIEAESISDANEDNEDNELSEVDEINNEEEKEEENKEDATSDNSDADSDDNESELSIQESEAMNGEVSDDIPELDVDLTSSKEHDNIINKQDDKSEPLQKKRKINKSLEEAHIAAQELHVANDELPTSEIDFERHLVASPNSSFLWIKYIEFMVSLAEFDKARKIAERALNVIGAREEQEKFNIWVAYLNLENMFGTPDNLAKLFSRAVQYCDEKKIYFEMVSLLEDTNPTKAEEYLATMAKKFKHDIKVWICYGLFRFKRRDFEGSRALLHRAAQVLQKSEHTELSIKFANMEFKYGQVERGRNLMESVLASYPKRSDLWSQYLDQELKHKDIPAIRKLFERCIALNLSAAKMKFFFTRYLQFEKDNGTKESVEAVKQKAREFVESKTA